MARLLSIGLALLLIGLAGCGVSSTEPPPAQARLLPDSDSAGNGSPAPVRAAVPEVPLLVPGVDPQGASLWIWGRYGNSATLRGRLSREIPERLPWVGADHIVAVASGLVQSLALLDDGTVWTWRDPAPYNALPTLVTPAPVPSAIDVIAIAAGDYHSLALRSDGTVLTWGSNLHGQLGQGTRHIAEQPAAVPVLRGATAIAAGANHSLALMDDGTVRAWGHGAQGKLGNGSVQISEVPVPVPGLDGVTAIAAGWAHSLAITEDGAVWTWGRDLIQVHEGTSGVLPGPTRVEGLGGAIAVAAGWGHSLALLDDGQVWAWGFNDYGELGDGSTADPCIACGLEAPSLPRGEPRPVIGLDDVVAISAGEHHSLALRSDRTVWAWGRNVFGEVGAPGMPYAIQHSSPRKVVSLDGVTAIAAHGAHSLAILGSSDRRLPAPRFKP